MQADLPFEVLEILSDAKQAYSVHKTDDWRNPIRRTKINDAGVKR